MKPDQSGQESGWMIGRLNGVDGCFPEAYVQPTDAGGTSSAVSEVATEVKPEDGESTVNNRSDTCACLICYSLLRWTYGCIKLGLSLRNV